ncbi:hypothetical protein [Qipengyuania oceanensis]|uniref:Fe2OG dioxygenase domain-containing protein n=1 Tax=Qipengyuania oceanensis TaxID=1463597 RepID=A0A844YGN8_9SPHN|nr:hypothetical protein [Qipengyuania oceanensis]MXO63107.1 hypothetical protein [Qipengyuania oceanensis]
MVSPLIANLRNRVSWFITRTPYRHARKAAARHRARAAVHRRRESFAGRDLDEDQRSVVETLRRTGSADASAIVDQALLRAAYDAAVGKLASGVREDNRLNPEKDFWDRLLDEDLNEAGHQSADSPFVQLAIAERILAVVSAYFDDAPLLDYVYLLHSSHRPGPLRVSQLWHKDYDDTAVLKLFVYFTDCEDDADGPFTYLPADISAKVPFGLNSHRHDSKVLTNGVERYVSAWKGKMLSARFVDTTRCYHMGSRVSPGHERLLYMAAFTSYPKFNGRQTTTFELTGDLSECQRVALTYG